MHPLVEYIIENGKNETWLELAEEFNIRPGCTSRERSKAANDIWRNYTRRSARSVGKPESFRNKVEEFLVDRQSFINKTPIEIATALWKTLPNHSLPTDLVELEQEIEIIKQVKTDLRKAKVAKLSQEQSQLIDIYNEVIDERNKSRKRLFFDIETSPNVVFSWNVGRKINLDPTNIIAERAIICICYKWEGDEKVHHLVWDKGDDRKLLETFSKIINSADEIIGHNSDNYDVKWVRARCIYHRIPVNPKFNQIDTLKFARGGFRFNSNKLDYISQYLGVGEKLSTGGFDLWKDIIMFNSQEALNKMVEYCINDVIILEKVYNELKEYVPEKKFRYIVK